MTKVKICGITDPADATLAADFGADEIGLNFYRKSRRYISPQAAVGLVDAIDISIRTIGVFVDSTVAEIASTVKFARLDGVQLHGTESPAFVCDLRNEIGGTIIKAIRIRSREDLNDLERYQADALLLDSYLAGSFGGSGHSFDWDFLKDADPGLLCIYLAGGLNPENVAEAIKRIEPYAVDVASGVEISPGKKDLAKMREFVLNAKNA